MCLFSAPITSVTTTRIFCNHHEARQTLVYQMSLSTKRDVAMILPLPCLDDGDDPIEFIDLSGYPDFFDDLEDLFPTLRGVLSLDEEPETLEVHRVGSFDASFVPSMDDFGRLDKRFRLPPSVCKKLSRYKDYGFAVFKFAAGKQQEFHPFGLSFRPVWLDSVFFPTVHVHDGAVPRKANFDHVLYTQMPEGWTEPEHWRRTARHPSKGFPSFVADSRVFKTDLEGKLPNRDHWIQSDGMMKVV